ncbi:MAG: glycosyltransferase [Clostridium sp.]|nr:glycosyltransferase [Clostridium sp.]
MELVNVLISTFNGENYIREQIDSILRQSYKSIMIYVRDDGSADATVHILEEYKRDGLIILLKGENVGFGRSFLQLLQYADVGDYWAFCDQDDVWETDKVERAVEKLQTMKDNEPNLYVHDFWLADASMNTNMLYGNNIQGYSFQMAITECLHMGFSMVFNCKFRDLMLRGDINRIPSHDWWAELIAMEFGNIYIDDYAGAVHRRLDTSVSGNNLINRIKWLRGAMHGGSEIPALAKAFLQTFGEEINSDHKQIIQLFAGERYNLFQALRKSFYPKRWRSSFVSELTVRFLMLLGKI